MITSLNYEKAKDWILEENRFDRKYLGKCEAVMCLGNGYLGLRSAMEEQYIGERRGYFIAGTFNTFDDQEVTELPNLADILNLRITVNGHDFSMEEGKLKNYSRQLNLKTGELKRQVTWVSPAGDELALTFFRVVSLKELHLVAQQIIITPVNHGVSLSIRSGIDATATNSGSQHMSDGNKRFYDKRYMQLVQMTTHSKIDVVHNTTLNFKLGEQPLAVASQIFMERRKIYSEYNTALEQGKTLTIEKISNVYTSRDLDCLGRKLEEMQEYSLAALQKSAAAGYDEIAKASAKEWRQSVWEKTPILIEAENDYDQLAIRFAQYHLTAMTPSHDNRMSVAAKGLSGEGYKGHTFWDTEIFILPYFLFSDYEAARKQLEYRYLSLGGAHEKARRGGYQGAQFPWESAGPEDGEVTPVWGAADVVTGLPMKIWSGFIEQHITADVAFAVVQYYAVTQDQEFMDRCGYEIILDTAKFWSSRLEYDADDKLYHIKDVVGPDEYKEHVDDNAFTNYMAYWNIQKAVEYYELLQEEKPDIYERLRDKLNLVEAYLEWTAKVSRIYLPEPRGLDGVIPQDAAYLSLKDIDLSRYKKQTQVGSIFLDYNIEQISKMQVSKQADLMMLFFLMENLFSLEVKKANWNYYEPRTLHDSSLSLSTHAILANDMGNQALAYELFGQQIRLDLGPNMKSSDDGIHAAAVGGTWQCVVYGFGGVRLLDGSLRIEPKLPKPWHRLRFTLLWHGQRLSVDITKDKMSITNETMHEEVEILHKQQTIRFLESVSIRL